MESLLWNSEYLVITFCIRSCNQHEEKIKLLYTLAAVDDNVLGPDSAFEHPHFRMVSTTTKQAWGLNAEVSNTFLVVVHDAKAILLQDAFILFLYFLQKA